MYHRLHCIILYHFILNYIAYVLYHTIYSLYIQYSLYLTYQISLDFFLSSFCTITAFWMVIIWAMSTWETTRNRINDTIYWTWYNLPIYHPHITRYYGHTSSPKKMDSISYSNHVYMIWMCLYIIYIYIYAHADIHYG